MDELYEMMQEKFPELDSLDWASQAVLLDGIAKNEIIIEETPEGFSYTLFGEQVSQATANEYVSELAIGYVLSKMEAEGLVVSSMNEKGEFVFKLSDKGKEECN